MVKAAQTKTDNPTPELPIPSDDDVVEYTLRCVLAMAPGLTDAIRENIQKTASAQVRAMFGGERVYVGKKPGEGRFARNDAIKRDYWQKGERIPLLERRYGLSSRQLWYIIKS